MNLKDAKLIFKKNFIGPDELINCNEKLNFLIPESISNIHLDLDKINPEEYILIYGCENLVDKSNVSIRKLIEIFGYNNNGLNLCFYNQDWYLSEDFIDESLNNKWHLIQKNLSKETRGTEPNKEVMSFLPSSILCTYTFFVWWLVNKEILWSKDYVWTRTKDSYGDRIYVGKYLDNDDPKRSGFSIHRHLSIKNNYGCAKSIS